MDEPLDVHDQGIYSGMLRSLAAFRDGRQTLKQLIDALRNSFGQLHTADQEWKDEFEGLLSELEHIHNDCVERQSPLVPEEFHHVVATVADIEALVSDVRAWSEEQLDALRQIVWDRRPELLNDVDAELESGFSQRLVYELRSTLQEEIDEKGTSDGAVNEWGHICEDLMSRIMPASP